MSRATSNEPVWVTKKRKRIPIRAMEHGHMLNAMAWVTREIDRIVALYSGWTSDGRHDEEDAIFLVDLAKTIVHMIDRQEILAKEWDRRFCLVHEDCRNTPELGRACAGVEFH